MKNYWYTVGFALLLASGACNNSDEDTLLFEQTADERVAAAINDLEQRLTAPANGWVMRYQPVPESGAYNVLLNFSEDGNVRIRTDFGVNNNEFYDQTITYRVDNSLGLELIFETYSFFSYLFEQNGATFEAEYELNYANETPDGDLVFSSKTDLTALTVLTLEPAPENAESLLGREVNANLETLSSSLGVISPVYRLNYANRDLSLYLSLDTDLRTVSFTYATSLSGEQSRPINADPIGYVVQGNTIILAEPLVGNFLGTDITISAITLSELADGGTIEACGEPLAVQQYRGTVGESNDPVALLPTLFDPAGSNFSTQFTLFRCPLGLIYNNKVSVGQQVVDDVSGARELQLYYIDDPDNPFIAVGFFILNESGNATFALKDFTLNSTENQVQFDFAEDYTLYNDTTTVIDTMAMDMYLNRLTEGAGVYVLRSGTNQYEFYNPCNGWSFIFFGEQL